MGKTKHFRKRVCSLVLLGILGIGGTGCSSKPEPPPTDEQLEEAVEIHQERSHREQSEG